MSAKVGLFSIAAAVVLLPWLIWRCGPVRRWVPLAVMQILVGVALGPSLFGRVAPGLHAAVLSRPVLDALDGLASVGVLAYVFVTGLHLDAGRLRQEGRRLGGIALGSITVPFVLGLAAGWAMLGVVPAPAGGRAAFLVSIAICVAVTALPVLAAVLQEMGLLGSRLGQTALAVAALNDLALWLMLAGLLAVAGGHGGLGWMAASLAWGGVVVAATRPLMRRVARLGEQAVLVAGFALAAASAAVSEACGTGYLVGAFLAGIAMPQACRPVLLARLELVAASVLLPFFFMSTGLKAVIQPETPAFLLLFGLATVATLAGKLIGTAVPARAVGFTWPEAWSLGAMMQTKGLMEVVVLSVLHGAGLIGTEVFSALVGMAVACTVLTAPLVRLFARRASASIDLMPTAS